MREQAGRLSVCVQTVGAFRGHGQAVERPPRQGPAVVVVEGVEFDTVANSLREVVRDDLDVFGEAVAEPLLEPISEACVDLGAGHLGQAVVGDVPDDDASEPEGIVAVEPAAIGPDQLLVHQREQRCADWLRLVRRSQGSHGRSLKGAPNDGCPLGHHLLGRSQAIDPRCHESVDRRRDLESVGITAPRPVALRSGKRAGIDEPRDQLLEVKRVSFSDVENARSHAGRDRCPARQCVEHGPG